MVEPRPWRLWWYATGVCALLTLAMLGAILVLFGVGIGTWGVNSVVVWGFAIASYVWWVAIGSGGTLISSMLLLTRQPWRSSVSRAVETMTMVAVAIAGMFPILHLGRPWLFYWLAPYPNTMDVWPQWRSALVWDFWAILSYLLFSVLFWYLGAVPDFATMRDRARGKAGRILYGVLALGWRGSAGQWHRYEVAYKTIGALGVPLVVAVHSVVGLDFAASLMPGWQESIFPPYFVVGALFSGFASVIAVAIVVRWGLGFQALITERHLDAMGKVLLAGSILMAYSYATEWWMAWYSGKDAEREVVAYMFGGDYAWLYRAQLVLNCALPHALWFRRVRRSPLVLLPLVLAIDVGMWIERILIIFNTLGRGYLPSLWRTFHPTLWDWTLLITPFGFFGLMMLLACRLVPMVAIHEMRQLVREREATP
jgi:molybdopterin-containing oxidoreductase family membrane subunit